MRNQSLKIIVRAFVVLSVLLFAAQTHFAQRGKNKVCLAYEPTVVAINGTLTRRPVVNASGQKETIWIIKLAAPVCVAADPENETNAAVGRATEIQLVFTAGQIRRYRALAGQKVEFKGTLFGAHTQHHFREVLMIVGSAKKN